MPLISYLCDQAVFKAALPVSQPSCDWLSLKQVLSEGGAHPPETVLGTYYLIAVVEKV